MTNILVTGSNGQLGSELRELADNFRNYSFFFTDAKDLDITNHNDVSLFVQTKKINVIINCAAYTDVEGAELTPELADSVNNIAVANLAQISKDNDIKLIHISTDYVFDGKINREYLEIDVTNPLSIYGKTKLHGELAIKRINPVNSVIIRTSWIYSPFGKNFVKTMLLLANKQHFIKVVNDQIGTPTCASDLALVILNYFISFNCKSVELFHYSNLGKTSWYEFAKEIFKIKKINVELIPVNSNQFKTKAKRPKFSILSKEKIINKLNIQIIDWKSSLNSSLKRF